MFQGSRSEIGLPRRPHNRSLFALSVILNSEGPNTALLCGLNYQGFLKAKTTLSFVLPVFYSLAFETRVSLTYLGKEACFSLCLPGLFGFSSGTEEKQEIRNNSLHIYIYICVSVLTL
jgi:hypothetical protein